jgi:Do/DeqQ family serine protease
MKKKILVSFIVVLSIFTGIIFINASDEAKKLQNDFTAVAEKAFPAVVVIVVKKDIPGGSAYQGVPDNPFFNWQQKRFRGGKNPEAPKIEGKGSGFIVNENGYVITNFHVADGSDEIIVKLYDGRQFKAKVIGTDQKTDLALLKINSETKLPVLKFADSDKVKVGHWSIAIGAPYSFDYSMTVGIVSQKGRSVGINAYENYIQTDAAINMGNSGGPLLNLDGDVIGVNDFIVTGNSYSSGNIGLGFAIPSNMVKEVMEQLMQGGKIVRPWIGIGMEPLSPEMKKQAKVEAGVLIREVNVGNPADKAGIEPGDVIVAIDGQPVNQPKDVQFSILKRKPGDKIIFTIFREGKKRDISVTAEKQDEDKIAADDSGRNGSGALAKDFGLEFSETNEGIVISKVQDNGSAAAIGLEEGIIVLAINKMRVRNIDDVRKAVSLNKDMLLLFVTDGYTKRFIVIQKK